MIKTVRFIFPLLLVGISLSIPAPAPAAADTLHSTCLSQPDVQSQTLFSLHPATVEIRETLLAQSPIASVDLEACTYLPPEPPPAVRGLY